MQRLGLVTSCVSKLRDYFPTATEPDLIPSEPPFTPDDQILVNELRRRGHQVSAVVWDDEQFSATSLNNSSSGRFDRLIVRSPWDYMDSVAQRQQFLQWLAQLRLPIENKVPMMMWLMDKRYLLNFQVVGIAVVPTVVATAGTDLAALIDSPPLQTRRFTQGLIIKPAVSAAGVDLHFLPHRDAALAFQPTFDRILSSSSSSDSSSSFPSSSLSSSSLSALPNVQLIQPFLKEIQTAGEWSLVYFRGTYSHAVHKRPASGQILVHAERGGSLDFRQSPPATVRCAADRISAAVPHAFSLSPYSSGSSGDQPLYLRIDLIETADDGPLLLECEGVEPELFFRARPGSEIFFADLIEQLS